MKIFYIISILLFFEISNIAQVNIDKYSIDSGGSISTNGEMQIIYTIGEVNIREQLRNNIYISEGFLNPYLFNKVNLENYFPLKGIEVFPNPTIDIININFDIIGNYSVSIINNSGKIVSTKGVYNSNKLLLNLKNFTSGLYYILIKTIDKKQYKTFKLVKQ